MKSTGSLFLTKSPHGIWYYQRWIPIHFRQKDPTLKKVFKLSLRTYNKGKAKQLSRLIAVKFDKLTLDLFKNPKICKKAKEELVEKRGKDFKYEAMLGDRKPPLDYRQ